MPLVLLFLALLWSSSLLACSCAPMGTATQELANSRYVFQGTAIARSAASDSGKSGFTFQLKRQWKGDLDALVTVQAHTGSLCARTFSLGTEYLVFVDVTETLTACNRVLKTSDASADLAALGAGQPPAQSSAEQVAQQATVSGVWFDPARAGEGMLVDVLEDGQVSVYWYGYNDETPAQQVWLYGVGTLNAQRLIIDPVYQPIGQGFGSRFNPDSVQRVDWGDFTIDFTLDNRATVRWRRAEGGFIGSNGTWSLQRLLRPPRVPASSTP